MCVDGWVEGVCVCGWVEGVCVCGWVGRGCVCVCGWWYVCGIIIGVLQKEISGNVSSNKSCTV